MIKGKKVFAVIPARGGSKAIPDKNIVDLFGDPLIHHTIETCSRSKYLDGVWVSTDSKRISNIALDHPSLGGVVRRPKNISDDFSMSEDALLHFVDHIENRISKFDILVFVQCTSPLTEYTDIDSALEEMENSNSDSVVSVCKGEGGWFCGGFDWHKTGDLVTPSYTPATRAMRQNAQEKYRENGAFYISKVSSLKSSKCRISGKISIFTMPQERSFEIDSKEDLDLLRRLGCLIALDQL
jgi:CMP-N,N'-diacetyllegionaminic acid synthase